MLSENFCPSHGRMRVDTVEMKDYCPVCESIKEMAYQMKKQTKLYEKIHEQVLEQPKGE